MARNDEMRQKTMEHIKKLGGEEIVDMIGDWLMRCLALEVADDIDNTQREASFEKIRQEIREANLNDYAEKHVNECVLPHLEIAA